MSEAPLLAPLVYGRTYRVDYRTPFIVSPTDFTDADRAWAKSYVLCALREIRARRDTVVWLTFGNRAHRVFAVACAADRVSADSVHDHTGAPVDDPQVENVSGRVSPVCLGWVAKTPVRARLARDLALFGPLYDHVKRRWGERDTADARDRIDQSPYVSVPGADPMDDKIFVWPEASADGLWSNFLLTDSDASVLLGCRTPAAAANSPFQHVTIVGNDKYQLIKKLSRVIKKSSRGSAKRGPVNAPVDAPGTAKANAHEDAPVPKHGPAPPPPPGPINAHEDAPGTAKVSAHEDAPVPERGPVAPTPPVGPSGSESATGLVAWFLSLFASRRKGRQ